MTVSFKKLQNVVSKWIGGPGGVRCSCCRMGTKKQALSGTSRAYRRREKQILRKIED